MGFRELKIATTLVAFLLTGFPNYTHALVMQSGSSALRSDIFVKNSQSSGQKKIKAERDGKRLRNEQKQLEKETRKKLKQQQISDEISLKSLDDADVQVNQDAVHPKDVKKQINKAGTNSAPEVSYTKSYASKLFQTYSGHITIEQKNIPSKISVTKGSTIQLNMENKPGMIWYVTCDNAVAKVKSNTSNDNMAQIVIETTGKGATKLIFDNIQTKDNNYKVIKTKQMRLIVDGAK